MTEAVNTTLVQEAIQMIDGGLGVLQGRNLITTSEMADLLLDVRSVLAAAMPEAARQS